MRWAREMPERSLTPDEEVEAAFEYLASAEELLRSAREQWGEYIEQNQAEIVDARMSVSVCLSRIAECNEWLDNLGSFDQ